MKAVSVIVLGLLTVLVLSDIWYIYSQFEHFLAPDLAKHLLFNIVMSCIIAFNTRLIFFKGSWPNSAQIKLLLSLLGQALVIGVSAELLKFPLKTYWYLKGSPISAYFLPYTVQFVFFVGLIGILFTLIRFSCRTAR